MWPPSTSTPTHLHAVASALFVVSVADGSALFVASCDGDGDGDGGIAFFWDSGTGSASIEGSSGCGVSATDSSAAGEVPRRGRFPFEHTERSGCRRHRLPFRRDRSVRSHPGRIRCATRSPGLPLARPAGIPILSSLDARHEPADASRRRIGKVRLERRARGRPVLRFDCRFGERDGAFQACGARRHQRVHPGQPLARRIASASMSEDQCDFGMLGVAPSLGQNLGRFRCLTLRRQNPSRDGSGGNERWRKVEGLCRIGKRLSLLCILEFDSELR